MEGMRKWNSIGDDIDEIIRNHEKEEAEKRPEFSLQYKLQMYVEKKMLEAKYGAPIIKFKDLKIGDVFTQILETEEKYMLIPTIPDTRLMRLILEPER